jgi:hypothetical protein
MKLCRMVFSGALSPWRRPPQLSCYRVSPNGIITSPLCAGAFDYIACPPDFAETERIVWSAIGHTPEFSSGTAHQRTVFILACCRSPDLDLG